MKSRGKLSLAAGAVILVAGGLLLSTCSPPALLNGLDSAWGSDQAHRVVRGVPYGTAPRQQLDVWVPDSPPASGRLPVVVFLYGGGWVGGNRESYGFAGRAYASQGFIAVVPDYRLVPQVRFPTYLQDSAKAVAWAVANAARFGGDPNRLTLAGHSAGAYNAAMLALDGHYLREAGVDPKRVRAAALLAGPYDFYPFDDRRAIDAMANWPRPEETQPIHFAATTSPPLWLAYGSADTVVKPRNSIRLAARLQQLGAPVVLREYPGKSHNDLVMGLSRPFRGRAPTLAESAAFLRANSR